MAPQLIVVEGNIGAGKTTIIDAIETLSGITLPGSVYVVREAVGVWENFMGNNVIKQFYEEPEKYTAPFQSLIALTMFFAISDALKQDVDYVIVERGLLSPFVFLGIQEEYLKEEVSTMIHRYYKHLVLPLLRDAKLIYLRCLPEQCLANIQKRQRPGEENIKLEYLKKLHTSYELHYGAFLEDNEDDRTITIDSSNELEKTLKFINPRLGVRVFTKKVPEKHTH